MKISKYIILLFFLFLNGCQTRILDIDQLDDKRGLYFEKDAESPYTGKGVSFYPNGEKELEINFLNGLPHGSWSTYGKNGEILRKFVYKNGQLIIFATFYNNGEPLLYGEYKNGKTHGKNIAWWPNGTKKFDVDFQNDKKHGREFRWHSNGQLALEAEYKKGKQIKAIYWDKEGNVVKKEGGE